MVSYFNQNQKLRGSEWREHSREERVIKLDWIVVRRVERIVAERNEWIKEK